MSWRGQASSDGSALRAAGSDMIRSLPTFPDAHLIRLNRGGRCTTRRKQPLLVRVPVLLRVPPHRGHRSVLPVVPQ